MLNNMPGAGIPKSPLLLADPSLDLLPRGPSDPNMMIWKFNQLKKLLKLFYFSLYNNVSSYINYKCEEQKWKKIGFLNKRDFYITKKGKSYFAEEVS